MRMCLTPSTCLMLILVVILMGACQAAPATAMAPTDPALQVQLDVALQDAAKRSGLPPAQLRLIDAEFVTWSDGAAGCPEPGVMYTQALVPGVRIRIQAGAKVLNYHGARRGGVAFCPAARVSAPSAGGDPRI